MLLRHATPRRNLASIREQGLLTRFAKGKIPAVWMHAQSRSAWAVIHTVRRHLVAADDTVVLEVNVPRSWMKKSGKASLWYCCRDIPAVRLGRVLTFDELAASPVAEDDVSPSPSTAEIASQLLVAK